MDIWTRIRRDVLVDGMSRREASRKYNLNFRTIQKILEPPKKPKEYARAKPKIGSFISVIHEILEADKEVHPKQRHTGKRIFDRLREEHGYTGGITVVRDEIRRWKQQTAEVFMPLAHPPGEAQFDFGEADGFVDADPFDRSPTDNWSVSLTHLFLVFMIWEHGKSIFLSLTPTLPTSPRLRRVSQVLRDLLEGAHENWLEVRNEFTGAFLRQFSRHYR